MVEPMEVPMNAKSWQARRPYAAVAVLALAGGLSLPGCGNGSAQPPGADKQALKVDVSHPIEKDVCDYEDFTGRVEAANKVLVQSMVTGYLTKLNFVDGDEVQRGQVLFEIDPKIYQAKYETARAALVKAEARHVRMSATFDINRPLLGSSVSKEQFAVIEGDYLESKAAVGEARAQLQEATENLEYTKVISPIHGKASRRLIDVGNMVKANETQLTYVYAIDPMYGYFDVDERTVIHIRTLVNKGAMPYYRDGKLEVLVGLAHEEGFSLKGYIDYVDQVLDAGTGTLKVRCVIYQPRTKESIIHPVDMPLSLNLFVHEPLPIGRAQVFVSPGMFIRVRLPIGTPQRSLLIAERAVAMEQGKKFINVVKPDNKVDRIYVELGQMHDGLRVVQVAAEDKTLTVKDRVVVNNLQRVSPGKDVVPTVVPMDRFVAAQPPKGLAKS
jgi:RND family efflux transporter MFP subunit